MGLARRCRVRRRRREINTGSVAPQSLEAVERAFLIDEHMHNEVDVVHEDPLRSTPALDTVRAKPELAAQSFLDAVRDGEDLAVRGAVADDEEVGDVALAAKVEDDQVGGLLFQCSLRALP